MRFRTIRVALLTAAAVFTPACAADHIMAPKRFVNVMNVSGVTFHPLNGANLEYAESETSGLTPCTQASWACISAAVNQNATDWVFLSDSWLVATPGNATTIYTTGYAKVSRGYWNPLEESTVLSCGRTGTRSCPAEKYLSNTCSQTVNSATLTTQHVIKLPAYDVSVSNKDAHNGCDGPSPDLCNGGGGDSNTYLTSVAHARRAVLDCASGGGGGGDPVLYCDTEWIEIDISYDGGDTWSPLWEGWGEVCDLFME